MATHVVTIANSLRAFGLAKTSLWAAHSWNAFKWGEGTNTIPFTLTKQILDTLSPTTAIGKNLTKIVYETLTLDSGTGRTFTLVVTNNLGVTAGMGSERLYTSNGWSYVYPDRTTEAEDRDFVTWASGTTAAGSWASQAAATTTWSQA